MRIARLTGIAASKTPRQASLTCHSNSFPSFAKALAAVQAIWPETLQTCRFQARSMNVLESSTLILQTFHISCFSSFSGQRTALLALSLAPRTATQGGVFQTLVPTRDPRPSGMHIFSKPTKFMRDSPLTACSLENCIHHSNCKHKSKL